MELDSARELQIDYASTINQYVGLSNDVLDIDELLWSYCVFEDSFSRVLCEDEVQKVSSNVSSITSSSKVWDAYENIYDYIVDNVEYARERVARALMFPCLFQWKMENSALLTPLDSTLQSILVR